MYIIRSCITYFWLAVVLTIALPFRAHVNKLAETDFEKAQSQIWRFARWIGITGGKLLNIEYEIHGQENIPETGSVVYVGNHQSMFDPPLLLAAIPRPSGFIVKEELRKVPIFSGWVEAIGSFFLPRGESRKSLEIIIAAAKMLKNHTHGMVIFPEGTRTHDGNIGHFKPGSLKIATRSGASIVPFAIQHTMEVMPRGTSWMRSGRISVTFLPALTPEEIKGQDTQEMTKKIVQDIAAVVGCKIVDDTIDPQPTEQA
ncbi:MAG: lysophospholipid acyltransferase family protein [Peptococcaceae bacterium]|nr:lysophospholipid acyltransferase family protein [Peptococcaceae bacterium]